MIPAKKRLYPHIKTAASGAKVLANAGADATRKATAAAAPQGPGLLRRVMDAVLNKKAPASSASKIEEAMHRALLRNPDLDFENMTPATLARTLGVSQADLASLGPDAERTMIGIRHNARAQYDASHARFTAEKDKAVQTAVNQREAELGEQFAQEQDAYRSQLEAEVNPKRVRALQRGMIGAAVAAPVLGVGGAIAGSKVTEERAKKDLSRQRLLAFGAGAAAGSVLPGTIGHVGRTLTQASQIPQQFQRDYSRFGGGGGGGGMYGKTSSVDDEAARLRELMIQYVGE